MRDWSGRYSTFVSTAALVVALTVGGAYAAHELVHSRNIANNAVRSRHIRNGQVRWEDLARGVRQAISANNVAPEPGDDWTPPSVRARRVTNQAIPPRRFTAIEYPEEIWDSEDLHSDVVESSRLTAHQDGTYIVQGFFTFEGREEGLRTTSLIVDGNPAAVTGTAYAEEASGGNAAPIPGSGGNAFSLSAPIPLKVGDYVQMWCWQSSATPLNVMGDSVHKAELGMYRIGPYVG